jgi:alpha-glucosidase
MEKPLDYLTEKTVAGLPFLMKYSDSCWVAITEAHIDNFSAFYIGGAGEKNSLTTKLAPLPGEKEEGVKVRFADDIETPWRVVMIGNSPGALIESELIQNLNPPCAIADPSWIKPGISAWDHWWSGEVKMEMPVIKEYIDFASEMGWPYMLVDWQWYGPFNKAEADICRSVPQINIPEILSYAKSKNVRIWFWLYSTDVNRNDAYKKAFPLYREWGVAGVKIDFMDRDDQEMVNWYREIIRCAADNHLLVDFHGAYKPDGIIRTWPNMITREGVMGNEYYKFGNRMSPEHNVKLAYTRMLAGQMDYTPGGFNNVTAEEFKLQTPALVANTRAAELAKFVVYESPVTVMCEHPKYVLGQPGSDFLKIVPTVWDNIRFLSGTPDSYVAIAKQSGGDWFIGVLNNSAEREISLKLDFLPEGEYELEAWEDAKDAGKNPKNIKKTTKKIKAGKVVKIKTTKAGGYVAHIKPVRN